MLRGWDIRIGCAFADCRLRKLLHSVQLVLPVTLEGPGPLVKWTYRFGIGAVQLLSTMASHTNQSHITEHPQVLGDGRLLQAERCHNLCHRSLGSGKVDQNLSPPGLCNCVESIGGRARSCHDETIHSHIGMCQVNLNLTDSQGRQLEPSLALNSKLSKMMVHMLVHQDRPLIWHQAPEEAMRIRGASCRSSRGKSVNEHTESFALSVEAPFILHQKILRRRRILSHRFVVLQRHWLDDRSK
jgi:hypothetical protein